MSTPPTDSERRGTRTQPRSPEPAWDIARLFPPQGFWSPADYLALDTNRLVELVDGRVEVLPMPTDHHQAILLYLLDALRAATRSIGGTVRFAALPLRVSPTRYREPDLLFLSKAHDHLRDNAFWRGADLVMEVVSPDDPKRDYVEKREDYAAAGIAEYWIVDPLAGRIVVLTLDGQRAAYVEAESRERGEVARSRLLPDLVVDINEALDAD